MSYRPIDETWRWKMNAARAMGNTTDPRYLPDLSRAFRESADDRVRAMCAWAMGRIGGVEGRKALGGLGTGFPGPLGEEISDAIALC